jgi:polyhydroxyalkanoate synthase
MTRKNTPPAKPLKRVKVDPVAFTRQLTEILDRLQPIVIEYGERQQASPSSTDPFNVQPAIIRFYENALKNPKGIVDLQVDYLKKMAELWEETRKKFLGEESHEIIRPESNDKRFRDPVWNENAVFDFIKQSYLLTSQCIQNSVRKSEGLEKHEKA